MFSVSFIFFSIYFLVCVGEEGEEGLRNGGKRKRQLRESDETVKKCSERKGISKWERTRRQII